MNPSRATRRILAISTIAIIWLPEPAAGAINSAKAKAVWDAERQFSAAARRVGVLQAFADKATPAATIFVPEPFDVKKWLAQPRVQNGWDPNVAGKWSPNSVYLSCDGRTAIPLGYWSNHDEKGYFATVWVRMNGAWRWQFHFDDRDEKLQLIRTECHVCTAPRAGKQTLMRW